MEQLATRRDCRQTAANAKQEGRIEAEPESENTHRNHMEKGMTVKTLGNHKKKRWAATGK